MRNDARPVGHANRPMSAVPGRHSAPSSRGSTIDQRPSVTHDRQSHIVNREAEEEARRRDANDPVMPTGDTTLTTKI